MSEPDQDQELKRFKVASSCEPLDVEKGPSKVYKLKLSNVPRFLQANSTKNHILDSLKGRLNGCQVTQLPKFNCKKSPSSDIAFLSFSNDEERSQFLLLLSPPPNAMQLLKNEVSIEVLPPEIHEHKVDEKTAQLHEAENNLTEEELVQDKTTPFWRFSYAKQLVKKQQKARKIFNKFCKELALDLKTLLMGPFLQTIRVPGLAPVTTTPFEDATVEEHDCQAVPEAASNTETAVVNVQKLRFNFEDAVPVRGYRNKCEFSIGPNRANELTVGFSVSTSVNLKRTFLTLSPEACQNVSCAMKALAMHLATFCRASGLSTFDRMSHQGFWRLFLVRSFDDGSIMLVVQVNHLELASCSETESQEQLYASLKRQLKEHCEAFTFKSDQLIHSIASLQIQSTNNRSFAIDYQAPLEILYGPEFLADKIGDFKFYVSPFSFFQVNPKGTEVLYDVIKEYALMPGTEGPPGSEGQRQTALANNADGFVDGDKAASLVKPRRVLFDLCCGSGTIGIYLSKYFDKVIGIEVIAEAVDNAKRNSEINAVQNAVWISGKLEDVLAEAIKKHVLPDDELIVVLDPPRAGAHPQVIKTIRALSAIKRLVYVACMPESAFNNWIDLSRPSSKRFNGQPFSCISMTPVDMFPFTEHYELCLLFQR